MDKNQDENKEIMDLKKKAAHVTRKFFKGVAIGTFLGATAVLVAVILVDKAAVTEKLEDAEAVLKRTGDRAHRIGDTARYTLRSMHGDLSKGAKSIRRDIGKGTKDIRKTMSS